MLTVTAAFSKPVANLPYTISNVAGTGAVSSDGVSTTVTGSDLPTTAFTSEVRVGDIITLNGQTKMVQYIADDTHMSLSSIFSGEVSNNAFELGNVHDEPFTIAQKGSGNVHTVGTNVYGNNTEYASQIEPGYTVYLKIGTGYEKRTVQRVNTQTQLCV
jgi:hypothetical protein